MSAVRRLHVAPEPADLLRQDIAEVCNQIDRRLGNPPSTAKRGVYFWLWPPESVESLDVLTNLHPRRRRFPARRHHPEGNQPMTATYTVTVHGIDGTDPKFDANGAALLYGVTVDQIKAIAPGPIPADWTKAMRRRANEAFAATGGEDILDILEYWARRDHDAKLVLVARPEAAK